MSTHKLAIKIAIVLAANASQSAFAQGFDFKKTNETPVFTPHLLSLNIGEQIFANQKSKSDAQTLVNFAYKYQQPNYFFFELDLLKSTREDFQKESQLFSSETLQYSASSIKFGYTIAVHRQFDIIPYLGRSEQTVESAYVFSNHADTSFSTAQSLAGITLGAKFEYKIAKVLVGLDLAYHKHTSAEHRDAVKHPDFQIRESKYKGKSGYSVKSVLAYQVNDVVSVNVKPFYEAHTVKIAGRSIEAVRRAGALAGVGFSL